MPKPILMLTLCLFLFSRADAAPVAVGIFSFDQLIPPGPSAGVNVFNIANLTGDPASGGFALPPDFPIASPLLLGNIKITLDRIGDTIAFDFDSVGPGFFSDTSLQFADAVQFLQAKFQAEIPSGFQLLNGAFVTAANPHLDFTILPSNGLFLVPGLDSVVLTVEVNAPVPEPPTCSLACLMIVTILTLSRLRGVSDEITRR